MTDAGYLDEPTVVWERLNEIDGDSEYFNANFRPLNVSETNQQSILTRQEQEKQQRALDEAKRLEDAGAASTEADATDGHGDEGTQESAEEDPDYLFALKLQEEEEARVNGGRPKQLVSPAISPRRNPSPVSHQPQQQHQQPFSPVNFAEISDDDDSGNDREGSSREASQFEEPNDNRAQTGSAGAGGRNSGGGAGAITASVADQSDEILPFTEDGQLILSEEELEAQRQAERFYQERKRQFEQQAYQTPPPPQQQQSRGTSANRSSARQPKEDKGECSLM